MNGLLKDIKWLLSQKLYVVALTITAACGYGFAIVNPIIGIDDTAVELYLGEGLEVAMGRWTIYLLNKIFYMAEFSPFMMELVGVILLCMGATLFALLIRRPLGGKIGVVACFPVFLCPIPLSVRYIFIIIMMVWIWDMFWQLWHCFCL